MNQKPLNLSVSDITETRLSGYHAHFPVDPDTTARLDRVIQSPTQFKSRFRDRHPRLAEVLVAIGVFTILISGLIAAVIIREAIVGGL